jgi:hypothetical protein
MDPMDSILVSGLECCIHISSPVTMRDKKSSPLADLRSLTWPFCQACVGRTIVSSPICGTLQSSRDVYGSCPRQRLVRG